MMPSWPARAPAYGPVVLRPFADRDVPMVMDLATDPYLPLIGSLPAYAGAEQALAFIERQRGRLAEGAGLSFAIADASTDAAVGTIGLWLHDMAAGRAAAGYSVAPAHRGRGVGSSALRALTAFAWTIPRLHRIELYIEPWNTASIGVAESAGYQREGLLRSHQQIGGTRRDMLLHAAIRTPSAAEPAEYVSRSCGEPAAAGHG
jgi:RimJ/RimL family protein N-acetyltransferase